MRGKFVAVRTYDGSPAFLRIWAIHGDVVEVSAPAEFARLERGEDALAPVGVRTSDVFEMPDTPDCALDWETLSRAVQRR